MAVIGESRSLYVFLEGIVKAVVNGKLVYGRDGRMASLIFGCEVDKRFVVGQVVEQVGESALLDLYVGGDTSSISYNAPCCCVELFGQAVGYAA